MDGEDSKKGGGWATPSVGRFLLDPDPDGLGGGIPTDDASPGGGTTATASPGDDLAGLGTDPSAGSSALEGSGTAPTAPADPNQAAGARAQPQQAADSWQSIRDAARAYGYDPGQQFQDDRTFLVHLLQQAQNSRQADFYARLGQQLAPHANGIQTYLRQQQAPAPQGPKPWEAPEFDERWLGLVDRDPNTGVFLAKPGVAPEVAQKVNAFAEWKAKFDRNPAAVLNSMVEERAKQIAAETVRAEIQQQTRQHTIRQIVSANGEWLYQKDAQGNPVAGVNGPMLTPVGARYMHHLQAVRGMGVTDPAHQDSLAKQLVRAEFAAAQAGGQQQQQQQAASPQTGQAISRPNTNPLQAQPPAQRRANPAATEPSTVGKSLRELLQEEFAAEGVSDADFAHVGG